MRLRETRNNGAGSAVTSIVLWLETFNDEMGLMEKLADFWEEWIWVLSPDRLRVLEGTVVAAKRSSDLGATEVWGSMPKEVQILASQPLKLFECFLDETLVLAMQKGFFFKEALEVVYRRYYLRLCAVFSKWLRRSHASRNGSPDPAGLDADAHDLSQGLFMKLLEQEFRTFAANSENRLQSYIFVAARNRFRDWMGRPKKFVDGIMDIVEMPESDPRRDAVVADECEVELAEAFGRLRPNRYEVLERLLRGQGYEEIAREMNRSTSAVYLLKFKALADLKTWIPRIENLSDLPDMAPPSSGNLPKVRARSIGLRFRTRPDVWGKLGRTHCD